MIYIPLECVYNLLVTASKLINKPWKLIVLIGLEVVVFASALWVTIRFLSANQALLEAISDAIVIFSIIIVGMTIVLYGNVTKNRNLNILGFAFFLLALFVVIDKYEGFAIKISAFAAFLVAFAAFAAIDENRRLRVERQQEEEHDRKERLLNTIITWGIDIVKCESESQIPILPVPELFNLEAPAAKLTVEHINAVTRVNLAMRYQSLDAKSEYIKGVAKKFDKNFGGNLLPLVKRTANKLASNIEMVTKGIKGEVSEEDYKSHWESLVRSALTLVNKADQFVD